MKKIVLFMVFIFTCLVAENFDENKVAKKIVDKMLLETLDDEWRDYLKAKESLKKQGYAKVDINNIAKLSDKTKINKSLIYAIALFISKNPKTGEEYLDTEKFKKLLGLQYEVRKFYQKGDNTLYIIKITSSLKNFVNNFKLEGQQKADFEKTLYGLDKKLFSSYEDGDNRIVKLLAFLQFNKMSLTNETILYGDYLFGYANNCKRNNVIPTKFCPTSDWYFIRNLDNNPIYYVFRTRYGELQENIRTADFDWAGSVGLLNGNYLQGGAYHSTYIAYCYGDGDGMKYYMMSRDAKIESINKTNKNGKSDICKAYYDNYEWIYDNYKEIEAEQLNEALEEANEYCSKPNVRIMPIFYGKNAENMTCGEIKEKLDSLQENKEQTNE